MCFKRGICGIFGVGDDKGAGRIWGSKPNQDRQTTARATRVEGGARSEKELMLIRIMTKSGLT